MRHLENHENREGLPDESNEIETIDVVNVTGTPASVSALIAKLVDRPNSSAPILPTAMLDITHALIRDCPPPPPGTALIVPTSGSTGHPKLTCLSRSALDASIIATASRLGGAGTWLLALPATHIAGMQVVLRAVHAGMAPEIMDLSGSFTPRGFTDATNRLLERAPKQRRYTSLVPTQLRRLLDAGTDAIDALCSYDAVLVGGAHLDEDLAQRAAGIRIVTTYGMSETAGGCVYDGVPLDGVELSFDEPDEHTGLGRIRIAGPMLASGYLGGEPGFEGTQDRWFVTSDLGRLAPGAPPTLEVLGRIDDVIISGGANIAPTSVEATARSLNGIEDAIAVGIPDTKWGTRLVLTVTLTGPSLGAATTDGLRLAPEELTARLGEKIRADIGREAVPGAIFIATHLPMLAPGKPHRESLVAQITRHLAQTGARAGILGEFGNGATVGP